MGVVSPLPRSGTVLPDATRFGRTLRVSRHAERDLVVLSVWEQGTCTATFHLAAEDVAALVSAVQPGEPGGRSGRRGHAPGPRSERVAGRVAGHRGGAAG